jgi:uncharacterized protein
MKLARILFVSLLAVLFGAPAFSQDDENSVKSRMAARVAEVDALKVSGGVGENNKGFLEQRAALSGPQTQVMNAENTDRRTLYNIIASRMGLTANVVGEQRAESIRKNSAPGIWLQAPDGSWYKK